MPRSRPVPPRAARQPPGAVRIIGGSWRRSVLPVAGVAGLRPTPDRVRETVFNWLTHALGSFDGRTVIDLFAGSGALGFEAASRGAARVVLVEQDRTAAASLDAVRVRLAASAIEIVAADALRTGRRLAGNGERFDLAFVDPPYDSGLLDDALDVAAALVDAGGFLYAESGAPLAAARVAALGCSVYREGRAGAVTYHLLRRHDDNDDEEKSAC